MIPNLAAEAIKRAKMDYQQGQKKEWDKERHLFLQYYKDRAEEDYMQFVSEALRRQLPTPSNNITRRVIDRVSLVYMIPPTRIIGQEGYDMEKYRELTANKDLRLQVAERRTNLLGLIALKLTWRNGKIDYDIILDFEPFFDNDPLTPVAVSFPISQKATVTDTETERWQYWDSEGWMTYEKGGKIIEEGENEYGLLPFVFCFVEVPDNYFLDVDGDRGLVYANRELNVLQLDGDANIRFRSFGEMWAQGLMEDTKLEKDPSIIHSLPEGASINSTSPEDTINSVAEWMKLIYKFVARNHHLPEDFVDGSQAESGVAIQERNRELMDDRRSDIERWRVLEHEMYMIEKAILLVEANLKLPDEFYVDFLESLNLETPEEMRARWDWELAHNATTLARILTEYDPDRFPTEEDAQKAIDENKKVNGLRGVLADALAAPVNA